jgi:hypothetical protein
MLLNQDKKSEHYITIEHQKTKKIIYSNNSPSGACPTVDPSRLMWDACKGTVFYSKAIVSILYI